MQVSQIYDGEPPNQNTTEGNPQPNLDENVYIKEKHCNSFARLLS